MLSSVAICTAQTRTADNSAGVPALDKLHEVIAPMWHQAWPKKDYKQLRGFLPAIEEGVHNVATAKLPGILHEKELAWKEQVKKLELAAGDYKAAVNTGDNKALLDAAENLHKQFEGAVRVIRPVLKELDDFHAELYLLHHFYAPGDSVAKMQSSAQSLSALMAALDSVKLPKRLQAKEAKFDAARKNLAEAVASFGAVAERGNAAEMKKAEARVHDEYERLAKILE
jgi:hypothetical protein